MNWDAIGAVGEIVGAAGVILSLVYLAAQIKHNTKQVDEAGRSHRLETLSEVSNHFTSWRAMITTSREVASIWRRGRLGLEGLDDEERVQFDNLVIEMFWCFGMLFFYREEGAVCDLPEQLTLTNLPIMAGSGGVRQWWATSEHRTEFPDGLVRLVDDFYANIET